MKNELHVVLGGSGAIGRAVISALQIKQKEVVAVERRKEAYKVKTIYADLIDKQQALNATKNATHVYVCVGMPYDTKLWQSEWPKLIESIVEACSKNKAKLIFLDNIYMYGPTPLKVPFNENHSQNTSTGKGLVRKQVADFILEAHKSKRVQAVIGRSPDFYGPYATNSFFLYPVY
jgi:nucleoside-diphosphate-sugar epimerase